MAVRNTANIVGYGLTNALPNIFPAPIVSSRAPTANDTAQIGQVWIDKPANQVYVLTSVVANVATWVSSAGGGGIFSSLSVSPGPISLEGTTTINTTSTDDTTIGNATGDVGILGDTVNLLGTQLNINLTNTGDTSIGNTTGSVDITGGNTTIGATTTLLLNSTGDVNIEGAAVDIESGQVRINFTNSGDTSIGNTTGAVDIIGRNTNIGAVDTLTLDSTDNVNIGGAAVDIESAQLTLNITNTGDTSIGNTTGSMDIVGGITTIGAVTTLNLDGAPAHINTTTTGNTVIGNATGTVSAIGSIFDIESSTLLLNITNTGDTSIGNVTGTVNLTSSSSTLTASGAFSFEGSPTNVNIAGTGDTFIGNSTGSISAIGDSIALATPQLNLNVTGTGDTAIGNTTGSVDITGSVISINEFKFSGGPSFLFGSGSPSGSVTAGHGSFYLNTAGSGVNDRAFINTDGAMAWTAIVTVA